MGKRVCLPRVCAVRHRFHSICPYFAMFPETFVAKHLAASRHEGVVFDPFCGRGTTVFESLVQGRHAAGCDVSPVAACVSGAKSDPPAKADVLLRLNELEDLCAEAGQSEGAPSGLEDFFSMCFAPGTMAQVMFLRSALDWEWCKTDRFIAALSLGALHGESHKSPNYLANACPVQLRQSRRILSGGGSGTVMHLQRERDAFEILRRMSAFRFATPPPGRVAQVRKADARHAAAYFPAMRASVTDVITSPPYLDTTNYREDQWLRCWFLGEEPLSRPGDDGRRRNAERYWAFLTDAWKGMSDLLADECRLVVRIGGRRFGKGEVRSDLLATMSSGLGRQVALIDSGVTSEVKRSQASSFRGSRPSASFEHDFCFRVT